MKSSPDKILYAVGLIGVIGIITSSYLLLQNQSLKNDLENISVERNTLSQNTNTMSSALSSASTTITELEEELEELKEDLEDLADDYRDERDKNGEFEDQIRDLAGTLGDLDKLASIDEELLQKYSKVYFLNENYIPEKVKQIDDKYLAANKDVAFFHARALDHLEDMIKAARKKDHELQVTSAYRSFDEQSELKGHYTHVYGEGANAFSADQGYSEHQLGTTVDLTVPSVGGTYPSFANTEAYEWLLDNAYKYGFILSYPEDNDFYVFEPWHWRFVGTDLARHLDRSDETFYTMEQREIDEYLLELFD